MTNTNEGQEENQTEIQIQSDVVKIKKPRTAKQIEAFKRCAEKRKQNLMNKNVMPKQVSLKEKEKEKENENASERNEIRAMINELNQLKNQLQAQTQPQPQPQQQPVQTITVKDQSQSQNKVNQKPTVSFKQPERDMQNDMDVEDEPMTMPTSIEHGPMQITNDHYSFGFDDENETINNSNVSRTRKRNVHQMNPYEDDRRSMVEKIYMRNQNSERQARMDEMRNRMQVDNRTNENSIQIIQPRNMQDRSQNQNQQQHQTHSNSNMNTNMNRDRDGRGEIMTQAQVMASMIKTGSNTISARKSSAMAVNGLRVATGRRF